MSSSQSFPSWSDLKDNVPTLTGTDDFEKWDKALRMYCLGKGVLTHLTEYEPEPHHVAVANYTELNSYDREYTAGLHPPAGVQILASDLRIIAKERLIEQGNDNPTDQQITDAVAIVDEDFVLTKDMLDSWTVWARRERLARTVLLLTIHEDLSLDYESYPTARLIYTAVLSRFRTFNPEKVALIQREMRSLYLGRGSTADQANKFYADFVKQFAALNRLSSPVDDGERVANILTSMHIDYSILLRAQWANETDKTWSKFTAVFSNFVESLRASEERENGNHGSLAASAPARLSANSGDKKKKKFKCKHHPNATSHKTADCKLGKKLAKEAKEAKEKAAKDKAATGNVSALAPIDIDGYYNGSCIAHASPAPAVLDRSWPSPDGYVSASVEMLEEESSESFASAASTFNAGGTGQRKVAILIDSGATHHIFGDNSLLQNIQGIEQPLHIQLAGTRYEMELKHMGTFACTSHSGDAITFPWVYYTPDTTDNMLSLGALNKDGWKFVHDNMRLVKGNRYLDVKPIYKGNRLGVELFVDEHGQASGIRKVTRDERPVTRFGSSTQQAPTNLTASTSQPSRPGSATQTSRPASQASQAPPTQPTRAREPAPYVATPLHEIHRRYGHLGKNKLLNMARNGLIPGKTYDDLKDDPFTIANCKACMRYKTTEMPAPGPSNRGNSEKREYVHVDLKQLVDPADREKGYWLAFVSDFVGYRVAIPIKDKTETADALSTEVMKLERQAGVTVTVIRSDRGTEFKNEIISNWCKSFGIMQQFTPSYSPQYNGVAERFNRTVSEMVKTVLDQSGLKLEYWREATWHCNNLINMTTMHNADMTVWEKFTGRKPHLDRWLPFGARVYIRHEAPASVPTLERQRSVMARVISHNMNRPGWKVVNTMTRQVVETAHVWEYKDGREGAKLQPMSDDHLLQYEVDEWEGDLPIATAASIANIADPLDSPPSSGAHSPAQVEAAVSGFALEEHEGHLASLAAEEIMIGDPTSAKQALEGPHGQQWLEAMQSEIDNLNGKGTWSSAKLPPNRTAITCKWVFKTKLDADGNVSKYKARLVARGFAQVPGVDFEETFAPVSRLSSLRLLLTLAATLDYELAQLDVEGAYLNGPLSEEIYIAPPDKVEVQDGDDCLLLHKALYGLKQSGRAWWLELGSALKDYGFNRCSSEWGLHCKVTQQGPILLLAYVDDILIAAPRKSQTQGVMRFLASRWKITEIGEPSQMLSMKITRDRPNRKIYLSSTDYIERMALKYHVTQLNEGKTTPLPATSEFPGHIAENDDEKVDDISHRTYRQLIGILLWLGMSDRPDLAFVASLLGRASHAPTALALKHARRALGFAYRTRLVRLRLGGKPDQLMYMLVDSDFGGDIETRRSTSGYVLLCHGSPIGWASRRQGSVASSTTAAEYVAVAEATKEVMWIRQLLEQLNIHAWVIKKPVKLLVDNQSAIRIAEKPVSFPLAKHIDVRHHLVREEVEKGEIALEYIKTQDQHADIFTKSLPGPTHTRHAEALGLTGFPKP